MNNATHFIVTDKDCALINYPYACKSFEQAEEVLTSLLDREPRGGYRIVAAKATVK